MSLTFPLTHNCIERWPVSFIKPGLWSAYVHKAYKFLTFACAKHRRCFFIVRKPARYPVRAEAKRIGCVHQIKGDIAG